jgi:hypothetical protein
MHWPPSQEGTTQCSSNGFLHFDDRCIGRALAVAIQGHLYYGIDVEIEAWVAKIAP